MTKKRFRHDFLRGLGSALLELQDCGEPQKYYDAVMYGCLHNTTYDMQCEGSRGWYLYQAALLVGGDSIEKAVIERYAHGFNNNWFFSQLTDILYCFAENGSESARNALHNKYGVMLDKLSRSVPSRRKTYFAEQGMFDTLCVWLTSLDGWSAFKKIVADVSGKLIPRDGSFFSEWFYDNSKDKFGAKRVQAYLEKRYGTIAAYCREAAEWENRKLEPTPTAARRTVILRSGEIRPGKI